MGEFMKFLRNRKPIFSIRVVFIMLIFNIILYEILNFAFILLLK